MSSSQTTLLHPSFGERFLEDHAGRLITNPEIALVELVANSWDAGARNVDITWPEKEDDIFQIEDDGTGMTKNEFERIWPMLNYNRHKEQGANVVFPDGHKELKRHAYGTNGKGRHSLFCFSDSYNIETWRDDSSSTFEVSKDANYAPYEIKLSKEEPKKGHGTRIWCEINRNYIPIEKVHDLLGSRFITDPDFSIVINGEKINLLDLEGVDERIVEVTGEGQIRILQIDSKRSGRLSKTHGVAWWVNKRLVGEHSWRGVEGAYLDGRSSEAKRYSFVVEADFLKDEVKADWSGFKENERVKRITDFVNEKILEAIQEVMEDVRRESKRGILTKHKDEIKQLSKLSKKQVGDFIDKIQMKCPRMTQQDLSKAVDIFINMDLSRTGYALLQQLVALSPNNIDKLHEILDKWSVADAYKVLSELQWRLDILAKMEDLVENPNAKELQELQPLFERGLWIFGPEYESIEYQSNKSLATILREFFEGTGSEIDTPLRRPDFVILPDRSLSVYTADDYEDGEISGIKKVLIIELKRGGSTIDVDGKRQAQDYAMQIRDSGKLPKTTKIVCFVLGASIDKKAEGDSMEGDQITVKPITYNVVLRKAHARTFNLMKKIRESKQIEEQELIDEDIADVLMQSDLSDFSSSEEQGSLEIAA